MLSAQHLCMLLIIPRYLEFLVQFKLSVNCCSSILFKEQWQEKVYTCSVLNVSRTHNFKPIYMKGYLHKGKMEVTEHSCCERK